MCGSIYRGSLVGWSAVGIVKAIIGWRAGSKVMEPCDKRDISHTKAILVRLVVHRGEEDSFGWFYRRQVGGVTRAVCERHERRFPRWHKRR